MEIFRMTIQTFHPGLLMDIGCIAVNISGIFFNNALGMTNFTGVFLIGCFNKAVRIQQTATHNGGPA